MKQLFFIILFLLSVFSAHAQAEKGTRDYLEVKRGFKTFVLATPINQYLESIKFEMNSKSEKVYSVTDSTYLKAGTISIKQILIYTYKDTISQIAIHVDEFNNQALKSALIALYGENTYRPFKNTRKFDIWMSKNTELSYNAEYNINEGLAVFKDYPLARTIKQANEGIDMNNANEL